MPTTQHLLAYPWLTIRQGFEVGEVFGMETPNRYTVLAPNEQPILRAAEREGGFLGAFTRQLGGHTVSSFVVDLLDNVGAPVLALVHPSRWVRQEMAVYSGQNRLVGSIEQAFTFFDKQLLVRDAYGRPLFRMDVGPLNWNMPLVSALPERPGIAARVTKRADAMGILTDVDTYRLDFDPLLDADGRALALATSLFIDFVFFERKAGS